MRSAPGRVGATAFFPWRIVKPTDGGLASAAYQNTGMTPISAPASSMTAAMPSAQGRVKR